MIGCLRVLGDLLGFWPLGPAKSDSPRKTAVFALILVQIGSQELLVLVGFCVGLRVL